MGCSASSAAKLPGRLEVWIDYKNKVYRSTDLGSERSFLKAGIPPIGPMGVICLFCNAVHSQGAHGHFWITTSIPLYRPRCLPFSWRVWELFYIFCSWYKRHLVWSHLPECFMAYTCGGQVYKRVLNKSFCTITHPMSPASTSPMDFFCPEFLPHHQAWEKVGSPCPYQICL